MGYEISIDKINFALQSRLRFVVVNRPKCFGLNGLDAERVYVWRSSTN